MNYLSTRFFGDMRIDKVILFVSTQRMSKVFSSFHPKLSTLTSKAAQSSQQDHNFILTLMQKLDERTTLNEHQIM